jgi:hypothetical protein
MAVTKSDKTGWHRDEIAPANLTALNLEGRFFMEIREQREHISMIPLGEFS